MQLFLVMLFNSVPSKLLWKLLNITLSLFRILGLRILSFHIRDIAHCSIRVLAVPKLIESNSLIFVEILRKLLLLFRVIRGIENHFCNHKSWIIFSTSWASACIPYRILRCFIAIFLLLFDLFDLSLYLFFSLYKLKLSLIL